MVPNIYSVVPFSAPSSLQPTERLVSWTSGHEHLKPPSPVSHVRTPRHGKFPKALCIFFKDQICTNVKKVCEPQEICHILTAENDAGHSCLIWAGIL